MKTVGVTGGHGFIGGYVVDELRNRSYEVITFDHMGRQAHRTDVGVMLGDIRDATAMTELAAHCDGVIHLAAVLGTQETIKNPRPAAETNVIGGLNFLESIAQYDLPGVYICVGNHWMNNTYSISKTTVERFVQMFNKDRCTQVNNVRVVNAYGPRQVAAAPYGPGKVRKITPAFVCRALTNNPVEIYGDGQQISDMVFVGDVAKVLVDALEHADLGKVYDFTIEVGPSESKTVQSVAELIIDLCCEKGYSRVPIVNLPMRPGEIPGAVVSANPQTMIDANMSVPLTSLRDGMNMTIDYFIKNRGITWEIESD